MNVFANLQVYAQKWSVKETRNFTEEEISLVREAVVVPSTYGASVKFIMRNGGETYIPLSQDATVGIGEVVDISTAKLIVLSKTGESDIMRVYA